jgi:hypothetical protein
MTKGVRTTTAWREGVRGEGRREGTEEIKKNNGSK